MKDINFFRNTLGFGKNIIKIELFKIFLFLLQVSAILINILIYYLGWFILNHILKFFLKAAYTFNNSAYEFWIFVVSSSLSINFICVYFLLYFLDSLLKFQELTRNGQIYRIKLWFNCLLRKSCRDTKSVFWLFILSLDFQCFYSLFDHLYSFFEISCALEIRLRRLVAYYFLSSNFSLTYVIVSFSMNHIFKL